MTESCNHIHLMKTNRTETLESTRKDFTRDGQKTF